MYARGMLLLVLTTMAAPIARAQLIDEEPPRPTEGWLEVRSVSGALASSDARRGAASGRALLTRCARQRARQRESLTAEGVDFELVVAPSGRVLRVELPPLDPDERTPAIAGWRRCTIRALRRLRFAAAEGESTVRARLVFARGDSVARERDRR